MSVNATLWRVALLFSLSFCCVVQAQEATKRAQTTPEMTSPSITPTSTTVSDSESDAVQPKPRYFKDLNRMEMLESRAQVANDPSCHWLNRRINQLEAKLKGSMDGMDMRFGYHKKELDYRKKEWICLKCGVEGPSVRDYAKCHFRR